MKLVKGASTYTLPTYSGVTKMEFNVRTDTVDKALQHGALLTGDGQIDSRTVEVEVVLVEATAAAYQTAVDDLKRYAYRADQKLYLTTDRYINIKGLSKYSEVFYDGFYMVKSTITLTFLATDPFIYTETALAETETITTSPQVLTINNPGNVDTPVIITVTPTEVNTSMSLVNTTDENRTFGYADVSFIVGTVLVADSVEGTVYRDTTNTINDMGGTFLRLLPGDNSITYTGAVGTVKFDYQERWL